MDIVKVYNPHSSVCSVSILGRDYSVKPGESIEVPREDAIRWKEYTHSFLVIDEIGKVVPVDETPQVDEVAERKAAKKTSK